MLDCKTSTFSRGKPQDLTPAPAGVFCCFAEFWQKLRFCGLKDGKGETSDIAGCFLSLGFSQVSGFRLAESAGRPMRTAVIC